MKLIAALCVTVLLLGVPSSCRSITSNLTGDDSTGLVETEERASGTSLKRHVLLHADGQPSDPANADHAFSHDSTEAEESFVGKSRKGPKIILNEGKPYDPTEIEEYLSIETTEQEESFVGTMKKSPKIVHNEGKPYDPTEIEEDLSIETTEQEESFVGTMKKGSKIVHSEGKPYDPTEIEEDLSIETTEQEESFVGIMKKGSKIVHNEGKPYDPTEIKEYLSIETTEQEESFVGTMNKGPKIVHNEGKPYDPTEIEEDLSIETTEQEESFVVTMKKGSKIVHNEGKPYDPTEIEEDLSIETTEQEESFVGTMKKGPKTVLNEGKPYDPTEVEEDLSIETTEQEESLVGTMKKGPKTVLNEGKPYDPTEVEEDLSIETTEQEESYEYKGEADNAKESSEVDETFVIYHKRLTKVNQGNSYDSTEEEESHDERATHDSSHEPSGIEEDGTEAFQPFISSKGQTEEGTEKWAYVDVRPGVHMFYWLYHSYHPDGYQNRPWILWLQGGPGGSSCGYGNFEIIGPLGLSLTERNTTWVKEANILFVDNPVGAGYSYVDQLNDLTRTTDDITQDLLNVMQAFMADNPEFSSMPFYVFGQSYGGKMGAHFARTLYDEIQNERFDINLKGYAMGNAWISPVDSVETWGPLLYWMSIVDEPGLADIQQQAAQCRIAVNDERWQDATNWYRQAQYAVNRRSNYVDFYNILKFRVFSRDASYDPSVRGGLDEEMWHINLKPMQEWDLDDLMNGPIREKLGIIPEHVTWGGQSGPVFTFQEGDFMKPVVSILDDSLENTPLHVIVYQGQLDLICDTVGAMNFVQLLTWSGLNDYNNAQRNHLVDPSLQTDTFVKANGNFKFYWNQRSGHAMPKDDGNGAYRMLLRILNDEDR